MRKKFISQPEKPFSNPAEDYCQSATHTLPLLSMSAQNIMHHHIAQMPKSLVHSSAEFACGQSSSLFKTSPYNQKLPKLKRPSREQQISRTPSSQSYEYVEAPDEQFLLRTNNLRSRSFKIEQPVRQPSSSSCKRNTLDFDSSRLTTTSLVHRVKY